MAMTPFRRLIVEGPDFSAGARLWAAHVNLGHPFAATDGDPVERNHSIRLMAQAAEPTEAIIAGEGPGTSKTSVAFHQPQLLSAAVTSVRFGGRDAVAAIAIRSAVFEPVRIAGDNRLSRYSELHVAPRADWPDGPFERDREGQFQIVAPKLRATSGVIRVGYADPTQHGFAALSKRLSMDWKHPVDQSVRIFGNLRIKTTATLDAVGSPPKKAQAVVFELVPEGVELDLRVPNPFATKTVSWLDLRLRLVAVRGANRTDLCLDLVGGTPESLGILSSGLAWMMQDLSTRGGNVVLQVDRRDVPPLSWPLIYNEHEQAYACGAPGTIPEVMLRRDGVGIKVLTRTDPDGGAPGVAEIMRPVAQLPARSPDAEFTLVLESAAGEPAAPAGGPPVTLTWSEPSQAPRTGGNPDTVALGGFSGTVAVEALGHRLSEVWAASGAIPPGTWPPYAFVALERGWVQIPLMDAPKPDASGPAASAPRGTVAGPSAFAGFMRVDVSLGAGSLPAEAAASDGTDLPGLLITAASRLSVTVTWKVPLADNGSRKIVVKGEGCSGTLDGLLWAGEASPSPAEILPPREAGPAALRGIPIAFGGRDVLGWDVEIGAIDAGKLDTVSFPLPVRARADAGPLLIWHPHPDIALVSTVAMTRSAESAVRPSTTRELVPTQLGSTGKLALTFGGGRLPDVVKLPAGTRAHGDGRWRWPWPAATAAKGLSLSSPVEQAGVALAALTLPGIEFTLGPNAARLSSDAELLFSLRFDLPLLDELFANAKAPEQAMTAARQPERQMRELPPTALDLRRLSDVWLENARHLAHARTQADRVILSDPSGDSARVGVWHGLEGPPEVAVRGLVEPYRWLPKGFVLAASTPEQGANLGAFRLGDETDWYSGDKALAGLTANFSIASDGTLTKDEAGVVKIDGFASSSFKVEPPASSGGEPKQLHDARGLSVALDPRELSNIVTAREVSLRGALGNQRFLLATRHTPIEIRIGKNALCFWFRDLPMKRPDGPDGDGLEFDRTGGIETGRGPDPESIAPDRVAKTLYEWRFYSSDGTIGRFEIPLAGPFAARPLRLLAFAMKDDGTPALLEVLASVKLVAADPVGMPQTPAFGPEDAYGSGNLVVLRFDDTNGPFVFRSIRRVELGASPQDRFPVSKAELLFRVDAAVVPGFHADAALLPRSTAPITLGLALALKDDEIGITSASLAIRLFGQACRFSLRNAGFVGDMIQASAEGDPGDSLLQLKRIKLAWAKGDHPKLTLDDAKLRAPLRARDVGSPHAFMRDYGAGKIRWLGVELDQEVDAISIRDEIDHDAGVIHIEIEGDIAGKALFNGCLLPPGRLRGMIAVVLKRSGVSDKPAPWPSVRLGSAFAEFAFDAEQVVSMQRVTAIRHRHVGQSAGEPVWQSSLRLDAKFGAFTTSSVKWPVGHASVAQARFDPHPGRRAEWTTTLTMDPAAIVDGAPAFDLVHEVEPRLCAHALPLELLVAEEASGLISLAGPWRFRAVVEHRLAPKPGQFWPGSTSGAALEWVSLDEICLVDIRVLARAAREEQAPATSTSPHAFQARYRAGDPDARIAGVVRRALASAGFPGYAMLAAIRETYPKPEAVPAALLLTGSCLTEVATATGQTERGTSLPVGVCIVPQWILPWEQPDAADADPVPGIDPLDDCPQIAAGKRSYRIAAHDAGAGTPRRLDGTAAGALAALDGTQSLIEARFAALTGAEHSKPVAATMAVDQAILEGVDTLSAPLFPRTLLALRTVAEAFVRSGDPARFRQAVRCVTPSRDTPRREVRFAVSAWPRDARPEETPAPVVTLLVADELGIVAETLPAPLASALSDPMSNALDANGARRADAALRALSLRAAPRVVLLARADPSYLTIRDKRSAAGEAEPETERTTLVDVTTAVPHVDWVFAVAPLPGLVGPPAIALRDRMDAIHASPALGWPLGTRGGELAQMQARLGDEEVRRNTDRAWAGRARSLSWPAYAWGLGGKPSEGGRDLREVERAAFVVLGQRTAFRRRATQDLCSPPDRLAVLAPPRARAPTAAALGRALDEARISPPPGQDRTRLAPFLPGRLEVTSTGQRPGVMMTHHEGALLTWPHEPFDPNVARFGLPAARGPLIARQLRAPRSSALPDDEDLAVRRRTFVAGDEREPDTGRLKLIKLVEGPAVVARFEYGSNPEDQQRKPHSVTLTVGSPALGCLAAGWNGRIRLIARVPGDMPARIALACIGLLPSERDKPMKPPPDVTLQIGGMTARFDAMIWGEKIDADGTSIGTAGAKQLLLDFVLAETDWREPGRSRIMAALRDASADTPIRFTVRCGAPAEPKPYPDPMAAGGLVLRAHEIAGAPGDDLIAGPPQVLTFDLAHVPVRRRWLPMVPLTLVFGDPAYDRELGSPVRSGQRDVADVQQDAVPHVLAVDRANYDMGATIHLAFWKRERKAGAAPQRPGGQWLLDVEVMPALGGDVRPLAIAATTAKAIRYRISGARPYAIAIANLRETSDGQSLEDRPARLLPGDRLRLIVAAERDTKREQAISVDVGIVAEPVLPPPAASYGLATLLHGGPAVGTALFATAPLPQAIDFPDLLNDLYAGHVRRRALFMWRFVTPYQPPEAQPFGYLVKVDRSGGGQLPATRADFVAPERHRGG